jgi:hypothetical protein
MSNRKTGRFGTAFVAFSPALLLACGGGASEPAPSASTPAAVTYAQAVAFDTGVFLVNPKATWKPLWFSDDKNSGSVATINLAALLPSGATLAGTTFDLQVLGTYDATVGAAPTPLNNVSALLVDAGGAAVPIGADNNFQPAAQSDCFTSDVAKDPFAHDFLVTPVVKSKLKVPAGAVQLRLSVDDCKFGDNFSTTSGPLRLMLAVSPAGS